jgi:DNA-binding Lrp family transcriptional regulator
MKAKEFCFDSLDKRIISIIQNKPGISHSQIAKLVERSQPTIGFRLKKLLKTGIFQVQPGINFKSAGLNVVWVNLKTSTPDSILDKVKKCPHMLNAFRLSGDYNIMVLLANTSLKKLYKIINNHFRTNPKVQKVSMAVVSEIASDFVQPINFNDESIENSIEKGYTEICEGCLSYVVSEVKNL